MESIIQLSLAMRLKVSLAIVCLSMVVRADENSEHTLENLVETREEARHSTKNSGAVAKRRARADAKEKFEDDNSASFDAYGGNRSLVVNERSPPQLHPRIQMWVFQVVSFDMALQRTT